MEACLAAKTPYIDTANYEHPDKAHFEYAQQWAFDEKYKNADLIAVLGAGFDPGVTNAYCAYALKKWFDKIRFVDIMDANAGSHKRPSRQLQPRNQHPRSHASLSAISTTANGSRRPPFSTRRPCISPSITQSRVCGKAICSFTRR